MKYVPSAKSRGRSGQGAGVSLFPFLAVLMCTMGALIVLLVVITRQARLQAAQAAPDVRPPTSQLKEDILAAKELVELQISQLSACRQKTEAQLAEERLKLGHVEDHYRQLREELARLQAASADLDKLKANGSRRRNDLQAEVERLDAALADARRLLAEAQQSAASSPLSYAVVPYEGPNQTHRRPIYLECREDAIILQPEGIAFTASDFDGPVGPGNPLDVALRATREYWLSRKAIDPATVGEPYPLLLVRPGGIEAYYHARAAMKSWGSEFGYELIGEDWELEFPRADAALAGVVHSAVDSARLRQRRLAEAAPSHYGGSSGSARPVYRAAPTRGGVVLDNGFSQPDSGFRSQRPAGSFGNRFAPAEGGEQSSRSGETSTRRKSSGQEQGENATPARPGEWMPGQARTSAGRDDASAADSRSDPSKVHCLAETRGRDWGLPDAAAGSVPITRPIRIDLHADRVLLVPERGLRGEKQIEMRADTADAIDELVSAVWAHMESWGIAGRGMYWRPVLKVHVAPDAERRFADLKILLEESGMEIRRGENPSPLNPNS